MCATNASRYNHLYSINEKILGQLDVGPTINVNAPQQLWLVGTTIIQGHLELLIAKNVQNTWPIPTDSSHVPLNRGFWWIRENGKLRLTSYINICVWYRTFSSFWSDPRSSSISINISYVVTYWFSNIIVIDDKVRLVFTKVSCVNCASAACTSVTRSTVWFK